MSSNSKLVHLRQIRFEAKDERRRLEILYRPNLRYVRQHRAVGHPHIFGSNGVNSQYLRVQQHAGG